MRCPALRAMTTVAASIGVSVGAALAGGCSPGAGRLVGVWSGGVTGGSRMLFVFRPDASARWTIFGDGVSETFDVRFALDDSIAPHRLDLDGFDRGPLAGRTLYGILEFDGPDAFRFDGEPGSSDEAGAKVRPTAFGRETVRCTRVE